MNDREIKKSTEYTFVFTPFYRDVRTEIVSGTATIKNNSGTVLQSGAVTVSVDGIASYTLLATNAGTLSISNTIAFDCIDENTTASEAVYVFDIVEHPIKNQVKDDDLFLLVPDLRSIMSTSATITEVVVPV